MPASDGRQFGPYRLVHQIATGGMAEIHLAKTRGIGGFEKFVALKMIHPNYSSDEHFIQMLIDEAKISVQLQHVNIAQIFDLGRVGDTYYIAMELVDGSDLYKVLRKASEKDLSMPIEVAVHIAHEVAMGLDYAHRKRDGGGRPMGIIHRDISPQNVLISTAGEVKVVDFGIAKATMRARQTAAGVIKGKYYYMSPEQAWGDPLDARTDIFSTGILVYEMLTGQMLYLEEDLQRLLDMVRKADIPPPSTVRKGIPPELDRIVMKALAKKREMRWQTAQELGGALERFLHGFAPDFQASRVTAFLGKALGDDPPAAKSVTAAPVGAGRVTKDFGRDSIMSRAEFTDENSIIFRMDELAARERSTTPQRKASPTGPIRRVDLPTPHVPLDHEGEDQTVVTGGPKGFGDATGTEEMETGDRTLDNEPTRIELAAAPPDATQELGEDDLSVEEGLAFPTMPYRPGVVPPALAGTTPTPAVSALAQRRPSRRTPIAAIPIIPTPTPTPVVAPLPAPPPDLWPAERPPSTSGAIRASLEAEDVSHYRLGRDRLRLVLIAIGATIVLGLVVVIVLLAHRGPQAETGSIEVVSIPSGANLTVGDKVVGKTPYVIDQLTAGRKVHLHIDLDHYEPWDEDDAPTEGKLKVIASLKPIVGHLVVTSVPDGAEVDLDGSALGLTPLDRSGMDPFVDGTIEVKKPGFKPQKKPLTWTPDHQAKITVTLERAN